MTGQMHKHFSNVLRPEELDQLLTLLAAATFEDGARTAGPAVASVKRNVQATGRTAEMDVARKVVSDALLRNEELRLFALPLRVMPPLFSRYGVGMQYGEHTDNPIMGQDPPLRSDIAITLFLTPPERYDGGELRVGVDRSFKGAAGDAVAYPATSLHRVEPVTRGQRLVAVTWVQSVVRDAAQRELLLDLAVALRFMRVAAPDAPATRLLAKSRANLLRMWAELG